MAEARIPDGEPVIYVTEESEMSDGQLMKHRPLQFLVRDKLPILKETSTKQSAQIIGLYLAVITREPGGKGTQIKHS